MLRVHITKATCTDYDRGAAVSCVIVDTQMMSNEGDSSSMKDSIHADGVILEEIDCTARDESGHALDLPAFEGYSNLSKSCKTCSIKKFLSLHAYIALFLGFMST